MWSGWRVPGTRSLVLWDIDGTLLTIEGIGIEIFAQALHDLTGRQMEWMPPMAGRTDHHLITSLLSAHGIKATGPLLDTFGRALAAAAKARIADMRERGRVMPGARQAVEALAAGTDIVQSVVTGNMRPIAEIKLDLFGFAEHIDVEVGGYGMDDGDRALVVRAALDRAAAKYGYQVHDGRAVVIGDTVHDIAGAHANGVAAIGVASSTTSMNALAAAGADYVLPSLADTPAVMRTVRLVLDLTGSEDDR